MVEKQLFEKCFAELPDEDTREYELKIAKLSDYCEEKDAVSDLEEILNEGGGYSFEAFFCLCTLYRRRKDYIKMDELIKEHQEFKTRSLFNHIVVQYQVHSDSLYDYDELLKLAYEDAMKHPLNEGCSMAFSNAFAVICEECNASDRPGIIERWYERALERINYAIDRSPSYAKFYVTKARLYAIKNRFREADALIKKAISTEDSSRSDYAITISNYQTYRILFQAQAENNTLQNRVRSLEEIMKILGHSKQHANVQEKVREYPAAYSGDEPYVFISYARNDEEVVLDFITGLQERGIRAWYYRGEGNKEEFPEIVGNHLAGCHSVILMLSSSAIQSSNVRREVNFAIQRNRNPLIVVIEDDVELTVGMELQLGLCTSLYVKDFSYQQMLDRVVEALGDQVISKGE